MTQRERFFSQMSASPTLPCLNWEFTYWETTLPEWHKQGLPKDVDTTIKAYRHFGIEGFHFGLSGSDRDTRQIGLAGVVVVVVLYRP